MTDQQYDREARDIAAICRILGQSLVNLADGVYLAPKSPTKALEELQSYLKANTFSIKQADDWIEKLLQEGE